MSDKVLAMENREGIVTAGKVIGLMDDISTCAALLDRIVADCKQRLFIASS